MGINRIERFLPATNRAARGTNVPHLLESLVECPDFFRAGLSPEEYRARQQLYQVAYEQARARVAAETVQPDVDQGGYI